MLFLLRNIRRKLMEKNKFTSYLLYAIGEIVLVVAGILIAFQLEEWRDNLEMKDKEQKLLLQINNEFNENLRAFKSIKERHQSVYKSSDWLLKNMPFKNNSQAIDSIQFHFNNTLTAATFDPSLSAIEALINTGSFDLISNDSLRNLKLIK